MSKIIRVMAFLFLAGFLAFLYYTADAGSLEDNTIIRLLFIVPVCAGVFAQAFFDPDVANPLWKSLCWALGVDLVLLTMLMGGDSLSAAFIFLYFIPCLPLSLLGVAIARPLLKILQPS